MMAKKLKIEVNIEVQLNAPETTPSGTKTQSSSFIVVV